MGTVADRIARRFLRVQLIESIDVRAANHARLVPDGTARGGKRKSILLTPMNRRDIAPVGIKGTDG